MYICSWFSWLCGFNIKRIINLLTFIIYRLCVYFSFSCTILIILSLNLIFYSFIISTLENVISLILKLNLTRYIFLFVYVLNGPGVSLVSPTTLSRRSPGASHSQVEF